MTVFLPCCTSNSPVLPARLDYFIINYQNLFNRAVQSSNATNQLFQFRNIAVIYFHFSLINKQSKFKTITPLTSAYNKKGHKEKHYNKKYNSNHISHLLTKIIRTKVLLSILSELLFYVKYFQNKRSKID